MDTMETETLTIYCVYYQVVNVIDSGVQCAWSANEFVYREFIQQMDLRYNHPIRAEDQSCSAFIIHGKNIFHVLNDGTGQWRNEVYDRLAQDVKFGHKACDYESEINYVIDRRTGKLVTYLDTDLEDWGESGNYMYPRPNGIVIDLVESTALVVDICMNYCHTDIVYSDLIIRLGQLVLAYLANSDFAKFILDGEECLAWDTIMEVYPPFKDSVNRDERIAEYEAKHFVWEPVDELQIFLQEMIGNGVGI